MGDTLRWITAPTLSESRGSGLAWLMALAAGVACWWAPGHFDAEHWSRYDPRWWEAALGLTGLHTLLMVLLARRLEPGNAQVAWLAPVAWVTPLVVLKPALTDLPQLGGLGWPLLAGQAALLVVVVVLATGACGGDDWRTLILAGWVALLAPAGWLGVRYGELAAQEEVVVSGRVESVVRDLGRRVGVDTALNGPPPLDGAAWLDRVKAPNWYAAGDAWYWAPAPGVGAGPVRLRYTPPDPADPFRPVLTGEPATLLRRAARPFQCSIAADGGLTWIWPQGPPPGVPAGISQWSTIESRVVERRGCPSPPNESLSPTRSGSCPWWGC
ncbi:MAG: hypothetical protein HYU66_06950 [Armatimonadetes bacterium]|nr:hypothetical protein [Armatimonadota bacterium]